MKMTVQTLVKADLRSVWSAWNTPEDIKQWNAASDDWHTTQSAVDLRAGGMFSGRVEAKDESEGFEFEGTYSRVVPHEAIQYTMSDGRDVSIQFVQTADGILVKETFDVGPEHEREVQRQGRQAIMNRFTEHVEAKAPAD